MPPIATSALPLLPLDAGVVLPGMTITIALETPEAKEAVSAAAGAGDRLVLVPRTGGDSGTGRFARVGTVAAVERRGSLPGGTPAVVVSGHERVTLGAAVASGGNALWVNVEAADENPPTEETRNQARELRAVFDAIAEHRGLGRLSELFRGIDEPGQLSDTAGYWPELSIERKVELLETVDVNKRVPLVLGWAREALAELELKDRIRTDVAEGMERTQREYLLRQQLAAIRKELGETSGEEDGDDFQSRLDALNVSAETRAAIAREIDKLERTSEQSPEHGWIRTWLDTVFELPWGRRSDDPMDIPAARAVLDADHTGLEDVKDRIIEHLAVRKLRRERNTTERNTTERNTTERNTTDDSNTDQATRSSSRRGDGMILALVGPPGVGKTSLGESVARATGRSFVRVALGGVRDEAEIRGHRRTYVGALPGRIVRAIKDAGTMNPVVLLDEIDKLGSDWRGDPSSALLEVLDPAQNHTFRDHYLDLDLDLSDVLFLATANFAEQIPGPLFDRMEVVRLDGYTDAEKVSIARQHLIGRQLALAGLLDGEVEVTDAALEQIVHGYTAEAGVRGLERQIGRLLRKAAAKVAERQDREDREPSSEPSSLVIDSDDIRSWLGRPRPGNEIPERTSQPGVATGLAVTGIGGDVLFVEASVSEGDPGLTITGQLGDVMQESAQIALSYVRAHAEDLDLPVGSLEKRRLHIHVPAGAVPKDGPSAGVTMTTAVVSLLSGRPVRPELGMTGEITLQGKVLPIGGVKQKVLAAHRAGLTEVVLPSRNEPDLEDVPESVREEMTFHLASDIGQVLEHALAQKTVAA
jgi:ATP-dependent Lon protease